MKIKHQIILIWCVNQGPGKRQKSREKSEQRKFNIKSCLLYKVVLTAENKDHKGVERQ